MNNILIRAINKLEDSNNYDPGNLKASLVLFFMHDDAEVNNKSGAYLREGLFVKSNEFSWVCHILYRVGENTLIDLVEEFDGLMLSLFKNADKRRHIFRQMTGLSMPSRNKVKVFFLVLI